MPRPPRKTTDDVLAEYGTALSIRRTLRAARAYIGRCEYAEEGEPETSWPGVPRCPQGDAATFDWCDTCAARDVLYEPLRGAERRVSYLRRQVDKRAILAGTR